MIVQNRPPASARWLLLATRASLGAPWRLGPLADFTQVGGQRSSPATPSAPDQGQPSQPGQSRRRGGRAARRRRWRPTLDNHSPLDIVRNAIILVRNAIKSGQSCTHRPPPPAAVPATTGAASLGTTGAVTLTGGLTPSFASVSWCARLLLPLFFLLCLFPPPS